MMSQEKNSNFFRRLWRVALGFLLLVSFSGCESQDPFVNPGNEEDPNWVVTVENDMTASMVAIIKVSFAANGGTLAGFMGDECCGIADYKADLGLYTLYISPAETGDEIRLRFYSPDLKRIFVAKEILPFRTDAIVGSVAEPYTPTWTIE